MNLPFSELLVILLVALLVIKPERLPGLAYKLGRWVKWAKHTVNKIKTEIDVPLDSKKDSNHSAQSTNIDTSLDTNKNSNNSVQSHE